MEKTLDCVLCGSCVVDLLVRPVPLDAPIQAGRLVQVEPIELCTGGIVSNAGIAMSRLGMRVAAFTFLGNDHWAQIIRRAYEQEGIATGALIEHPAAATSTTAVLIDASGERSFAHCVGAPKLLKASDFLNNLAVFAKSHFVLIGYYSLMPNLEQDLPEVLAAMREAGCRTALDAAGDGGGMQPLDRILPHLDVYVPSRAEAEHQTGRSAPVEILEVYRQAGATGLLGVKLGAQGALLSPAAGQYVEIPPVSPPGQVVDTTGAGDSFYAGLLTGLLRDMSVYDAGRLAAATGACCTTGVGASAGLRDYAETARLAELKVG